MKIVRDIDPNIEKDFKKGKTKYIAKSNEVLNQLKYMECIVKPVEQNLNICPVTMI